MIHPHDLCDHDGPAPVVRADAIPDDARILATQIVRQAVQDLASWSAELRADVEDWIDSLDDEPGTLTWCAWVLGRGSDEQLIDEVRERATLLRDRATLLRDRRERHRRAIEAAHNPGQGELEL